MAPIVQSPAEQARRAASCAAASGCDACAELHGCEFCQDNGRCVPADIHGPYPGTCRAGDLWDAASCPRAPKRRASEARVRAFLQSGMRGLNPEGAPVDVPARDLTRRVRFPVHRGRCYGLVFRTSLDLENPWQLNASASAPAPRLLGGGDWDSRMDEAVLTRFCPHESGEIVVGANPVTVQRGTWRAQLFSGPGSEEALRAAEAELEERKRVRSFQYYCAHCARGHLGCQLSGEPECEAKYTVCLAAVGLSREACERGPFAPPPGRPAPPPPQALLGEP